MIEMLGRTHLNCRNAWRREYLLRLTLGRRADDQLAVVCSRLCKHSLRDGVVFFPTPEIK